MKKTPLKPRIWLMLVLILSQKAEILQDLQMEVASLRMTISRSPMATRSAVSSASRPPAWTEECGVHGLRPA